jgi:hypothetical protein
MNSFVALEFGMRCAVFELYGQKRRDVDKSDAAVAQFYEQSDPWAVGE